MSTITRRKSIMKPDIARLEEKRGSSFTHLSSSEQTPNVGCGRVFRVDYTTSNGKWLQLAKFMSLVSVPTIGGWVFTLFSLAENIQVRDQHAMSRDTLVGAVYLGRVVNSLQRERDMSILYLSKLGPGTKKFLLDEYDKTDQSFENMWLWPGEFATHSNIVFRSKSALMTHIRLHRTALDSNAAIQYDEIKFYNEITEFMIDWMVKSIKDGGFGNNWKSLVVFQKMCRCLLDTGLERAYGTMFFAQGNFPDVNYYGFYFRRIHRFNYNYRSSTYYSELVNPFLEFSAEQANLTVAIDSFRDFIKSSNISGSYLSLEKAQFYFDNATKRVDYIYSLQEEVALYAMKRINDTVSSFITKILVYGITSAIVLIACPIIMFFAEAFTSNIQSYSKILVEASNDLKVEKNKTDSLLYQMLPKPVADRLKKNSRVDSEFFKAATVMFSSVVNFTQLSIEYTPLELIELLNVLYTSIDEKIEKYDVYKVETINDTYMVVSGVPLPNGLRHASEIAYLALDVVHMMKHVVYTPKINIPIQLQLGASTGSVSAGIVGNVMLRYCLFGDTVNIASRMKSNSQPNCIHLSETTFKNLTKTGMFKLQCRGVMDIKGKGRMKTYWLQGSVHNAHGPVPTPSQWRLPGETLSLGGSSDLDCQSQADKPKGKISVSERGWMGPRHKDSEQSQGRVSTASHMNVKVTDTHGKGKISVSERGWMEPRHKDSEQSQGRVSSASHMPGKVTDMQGKGKISVSERGWMGPLKKDSEQSQGLVSAASHMTGKLY